MLIAYATALTTEYFSAASGDSKLFTSPFWLPFFLFWYGLLYGVSYKVMKGWKLWQIGLVWALLGSLIEMFLFRGSFLASDLLYGLMFVIPFWLSRKLAK